MVGLTNNRSLQDEKLVEAIFQSHLLAENPLGAPAKIYGATATNMIIDARPTANAMVMVAKGAGTENMDYYKDCKKAYLGIDNIHVMRDSLNRVFDALRESEFTDGVVDRESLRRSGWLRHMANVLEGTAMIVHNVHVNASHVLIHCSDGWDRTSQLAALAQICLDPFYRTYKGFQILVEKDWLSYGHKFLDRCGHLSSDKLFIAAPASEGEGAGAFIASVQNRFGGPAHLKETSPVFHQYLECIQQLQRQFPTRFEYNGRYLERVHHHLYSCQFGTFLFNSEQERREADAAGQTISIWDWLNTPEERALNLNADFDKTLDDPKGKDMGVLVPDAKDIKFWNELYGKTDDEMNRNLVEPIPASLSAPIDNSRDDPILESAGADVASALTQSTPAISSPSPAPSSHLPASMSVPSLPPQNRSTPSPAPPMERQDSFRPFPGTNSAFSLRSQTRTPEPATSSPPPLQNIPSLAGGAAAAKSVWGVFSSGAAAAFTAAQGAAAGAAKELNTRIAAARDVSPSPGVHEHATPQRGGELPAWGAAEWGGAPSSSGTAPPSPPAQKQHTPATYSHSHSNAHSQASGLGSLPPTGVARSPVPPFGQHGSTVAAKPRTAGTPFSSNPWATNPAAEPSPFSGAAAKKPSVDSTTATPQTGSAPSLADLTLDDPVAGWKATSSVATGSTRRAEAALPPPPPPDKTEPAPAASTSSDPLGVGPL